MKISDLEEELKVLKNIVGDVKVNRVWLCCGEPILTDITSVHIDQTYEGEKVVTIE